MDIHRCRFVPYQPQAINALAFSHTSSKQRSPTDLRLALGRENGDVEIWNPTNGNWVQEKIFRGSQGHTIEQLAWTQDLIVDEENTDRPINEGQLRLFSSGGSTSITEWDLATGVQKRHAEGNFGDIWCFAAQPQWRATLKRQNLNQVSAAPSQMLAAGCSDGTVILFSTADDSLQYLRTLAQSHGKKSKVISITWKDRNTIVAGYENSQIKVIDVGKKTVIRTMSLGKPADGSNIVVWTVKCLPDGTLLSGDSTGQLKIWDAANYSLVQQLKTHEADILDISFSAKGDLVFTAGVDRRTVAYQPLIMERGKRRERWQQVMHRRFHQHDVKALATFESKELSVLVSGGMDTVPVVMPLRRFDLEYHRSLPHLPQKPQMSCSPRSRLMLTWWDRDLFLWQMPPRSALSEIEVASQIDIPEHKLLAKLQLNGTERITSAQISNDGQMIVAATATEARLFQIRKRTTQREHSIRTRRINLPVGIKNFEATTIGFSPDSKWLYAVRPSNVIALIKIIAPTNSKDLPQVQQQVIKLARKSRKVNFEKLGSYRQSINCLSFSSDSRIMASGDLYGNVDTWILEGHEDIQLQSNQDEQSESDSDSDSDDETDSMVIHGQKWIRNPYGSQLPQLDSAIIALSFKPTSQSATPHQEVAALHPTRHNPHPVSREHPAPAQLVAVTSTHNLVLFDALSCRLSDWSRRNPASCLPSIFTQLKDRVMGLFWDCKTAYERLYLYGSGFLFMIDISRDLSLVDAQEKIGKIGRYDVREALPDATKQEDDVDTLEKMLPQPNQRKRKRATGAGDMIREGEWQRRDNASDNIRANLEEGAKPLDASTNTGLLSPALSFDDEDVDIDMSDTALALFRREDRSDEQSGTSEVRVREATKSTLTKSSQQYYSTFRYRAIFGIVVVSSTEASIQDESKTVTGGVDEHVDTDIHDAKSGISELEVAIVERPLYDVELLPRFDGGQDWGT